MAAAAANNSVASAAAWRNIGEAKSENKSAAAGSIAGVSGGGGVEITAWHLGGEKAAIMAAANSGVAAALSK